VKEEDDFRTLEIDCKSNTHTNQPVVADQKTVVAFRREWQTQLLITVITKLP
jgi:hypothetical protein